MDTRILVVDDDRTIVDVMRSYLEQTGYQVLVAYDGNQAMHVLRREKPNLLLLDLMLPGKDGWEITRLIRRDPFLAETPIIMLTARIEDTDKIVGLELGADDYVTKPFNGREVVARVRALLRRSQRDYKPPSVLQVGYLQLNLDQRRLFVDGKEVELTPTEYKLLYAFMESPNSTFTREELLERGMGYAYEGMGRALDTHIKNLRKKIEVDPKKPTYIETVYSVGYRLVRPL